MRYFKVLLNYFHVYFIDVFLLIFKIISFIGLELTLLEVKDPI